MGVLGQPYLNLDSFIDPEAVKGLNAEMLTGIILAKKKMAFYGTGLLRRPEERGLRDYSEVVAELRRTGAIHDLAKRFPDANEMREYIALKYKAVTFGQVISLREPVSGGYDGISYARCNQTTEEVKHFPKLMSFVKSLPFSEIGRVEIFLAAANSIGRMHTDGTLTDRKRLRHEFIYMRTNLDKPFHVYDPATRVKSPVTSHSAYFNSLEPHGYDRCPYQTFSFRVDGFFTPEFRTRLGLEEIAAPTAETHI